VAEASEFNFPVRKILGKLESYYKGRAAMASSLFVVVPVNLF